MSDNLKFAKECGAFVKYQLTSAIGKVPAEVIFNVSELDDYTSRSLASQQAAHDAEIAKLRAQVAMLNNFLHFLKREFGGISVSDASNIDGVVSVAERAYNRINDITKDTQATAEQFIAECEQRGAVKALEYARQVLLTLDSDSDSRYFDQKDCANVIANIAIWGSWNERDY